MDSYGNREGGQVGLFSCHGQAGNQDFGLTDLGELLFDDDLCLDVPSQQPGASVIIYNCHGMGGNQKWTYSMEVSVNVAHNVPCTRTYTAEAGSFPPWQIPSLLSIFMLCFICHAYHAYRLTCTSPLPLPYAADTAAVPPRVSDVHGRKRQDHRHGPLPEASIRCTEVDVPTPLHTQPQQNQGLTACTPPLHVCSDHTSSFLCFHLTLVLLFQLLHIMNCLN